MRLRPFAVILLSTLLLSACGGGMVRRVSDPAASVQQLTVNLDGSWTLQLRLQNYSSIPMRYDRLRLQLGVDGQDAGTVEAAPAISIGPESADVLSVPLRPASAARIAVADALAGGRTLHYTLKGDIAATPEDKKPRSFEFDGHNALSPVPGLQGVLR